MDDGGGRRVRSDQWVSELSDVRCACGCGQRTAVIPRSDRSRGLVKGQARRFVAGHGGRAFRPAAAARAEARRLVRPVVWNPCACGCGGFTRARWLPGHALRGAYTAPIGPFRACACGCGESVHSLRARWLPNHDKRRQPHDWIEDEHGCWVWQRYVDARGLPRTERGGKRPAYRMMWEEHIGPIPAGHDVQRVCGNKLCVRPEHLVLHERVELSVPRYVVRADGCWIWQRRLRKGYGEVRLSGGRGRAVPAHRWMWERHRGAIPEGLVLHHTCQDKACVNPDHLEALTPAEHAARHSGPRRKWSPHPSKPGVILVQTPDGPREFVEAA